MSIDGNSLLHNVFPSYKENPYEDEIATSAVGGGSSSSIHELGKGVETISNTIPIEQVAPGDEILKTVQKVSDSHTETLQSLHQITQELQNKESLSMADALKMQVGVMEFQLKNEIISKATGSISNGIQTLFRNQ